MRITIEQGGVLVQRTRGDGKLEVSQEAAGDAVLLWAARRNLARTIAHHYHRSPEYCEGRVKRLELANKKKAARVTRIADRLEEGVVQVMDGRIVAFA